MKTKDLYFGTMKFVWLKLALGAALTLGAALLFALFALVGSLFGENGVGVSLLLWALSFFALYRFAMSYFGYLIKAGHVAVIAEAINRGAIPENQFEWGKNAVKSRFAMSNVYFVIDRLVSGAVRQLQNGVENIANLFGAIPGISSVAAFVKLFISVALGYIDECCLGYCFLQKDEGAFKSSCDGVVIYFQNAKQLLKNALKVSAVVILTTAVALAIPAALFLLLFKALGWSPVAAVILAILVAVFVRSAFIDSYIMIDMMKHYMDVVPETEISFDLYGKLSRLSGKFRKLFERAKAEAAEPVTEI